MDVRSVLIAPWRGDRGRRTAARRSSRDDESRQPNRAHHVRDRRRTHYTQLSRDQIRAAPDITLAAGRSPRSGLSSDHRPFGGDAMRPRWLPLTPGVQPCGRSLGRAATVIRSRRADSRGACGELRRAGNDRHGDERAAPIRRHGALETHVDRALPDGRLRPAADRLAESRGRGQLGDQDHDELGTGERPSRALQMARDRLASRTSQRVHHVARESEPEVRGQPLVAVNARHGQRHSRAVAGAAKSNRGGADRRISKRWRQR